MVVTFVVASAASALSAQELVLRQTLYSSLNNGLEVASLAFNASGTILASGGGCQCTPCVSPPEIGPTTPVAAWDTSTGTLVTALRWETPMVYCVAFSPGGTLVAATAGYETKLWSVESWKNISTFRPRGNVGEGEASLAFSPDGRSLAATAGDGKIRLWNVLAGTIYRELKAERTLGPRYFFRRMGNASTAQQSPSDCVWGWELATGKVVATFSHGRGNDLTIRCIGLESGRQDAGLRRRKKLRPLGQWTPAATGSSRRPTIRLSTPWPSRRTETGRIRKQ